MQTNIMRSLRKLLFYRMKNALLIVLGLSVGLSTSALVSAHGGDTTLIHACMSNKGEIRVISATGTCRNNETPLDWRIQGEQGLPGLQGPPGNTGNDGVNCWDLNGDHIDDPREDINVDSQFNALDCQGPQGPAGSGGFRMDSVLLDSPESFAETSWPGPVPFPGMSLTMTPVSNNVAVLLLFNAYFSNSSGAGCEFIIRRDGSYLPVTSAGGGSSNSTESVSIYWVDENPTVVPHTYEVWFNSSPGGTLCHVFEAELTWFEFQP